MCYVLYIVRSESKRLNCADLPGCAALGINGIGGLWQIDSKKKMG